MPGTLFNFPKAIAWDNGTAQAGATLTFSQTGTSTPQNIYTDVALATPHSNPVTADSEGVFAAIYLDPSLPDYRVVFKDSSGTTIYTQDDIPAAGSSGNNLTLNDTAPYILLVENDATANEGAWRIIASGDQLLFQTGNDALDTFTTFLTVDRSSTTVNTINTIAGVSSGSFTGTLTGCTTSPTLSIQYIKIGTQVSLYFLTALTGTSNTTGMTVTGLPSAIDPAASQKVVCMELVDGGTTSQMGFVRIGATANTLVFSLASSTAVTNRVSDAGTSSFTSSAAKGIGAGTVITYNLGWTT